jgi:hypothetical protein
MWNLGVFLKVKIVDDDFYVGDLFFYMLIGDDILAMLHVRKVSVLC